MIIFDALALLEHLSQNSVESLCRHIFWDPYEQGRCLLHPYMALCSTVTGVNACDTIQEH